MILHISSYMDGYSRPYWPFLQDVDQAVAVLCRACSVAKWSLARAVGYIDHPKKKEVVEALMSSARDAGRDVMEPNGSKLQHSTTNMGYNTDIMGYSIVVA